MRKELVQPLQSVLDYSDIARPEGLDERQGHLDPDARMRRGGTSG